MWVSVLFGAASASSSVNVDILWQLGHGLTPGHHNQGDWKGRKGNVYMASKRQIFLWSVEVWTQTHTLGY